MTKLIKRFFIKVLGLKNYLRILQRLFFLLYRTGVLRCNSSFEYYYFAKHLIDKGDIIIDIGANLGYYSFLFAQWTGDSGRVLAFEQDAACREIFNEKAKKYKNITLYPYTLRAEVQIEKPSVLFGNLDRINYIRCDIEGFEYIILSDMKEIISEYKPIIQVKSSPDNTERLLELFDELGYAPYKLYKYRLIPQNEEYISIPGDYFFIADSTPEQ